MKTPKPRTDILTVRLSTKERRMVRDLQQHYGERSSETIRRAILYSWNYIVPELPRHRRANA